MWLCILAQRFLRRFVLPAHNVQSCGLRVCTFGTRKDVFGDCVGGVVIVIGVGHDELLGAAEIGACDLYP